MRATRGPRAASRIDFRRGMATYPLSAPQERDVAHLGERYELFVIGLGVAEDDASEFAIELEDVGAPLRLASQYRMLEHRHVKKHVIEATRDAEIFAGTGDVLGKLHPGDGQPCPVCPVCPRCLGHGVDAGILARLGAHSVRPSLLSSSSLGSPVWMRARGPPSFSWESWSLPGRP